MHYFQMNWLTKSSNCTRPWPVLSKKLINMSISSSWMGPKIELFSIKYSFKSNRSKQPFLPWSSWKYTLSISKQLLRMKVSRAAFICLSSWKKLFQVSEYCAKVLELKTSFKLFIWLIDSYFWFRWSSFLADSKFTGRNAWIKSSKSMRYVLWLTAYFLQKRPQPTGSPDII